MKSQQHFSSSPVVRNTAALALAALTSMAAHANIGTPATVDYTGGISNGLTYGPTSGGNVFEVIPFLYMDGLGTPKAPKPLTVLNPALDFSFAINGAGTDLLTIDYVITNKSSTESFSNLRLWVIANPDGDQTNYVDTLSETWGAKGAKDPAARESQEFTFNPLDNIPSRALLNNGLTDSAPAAACTTSAGCDGVFALQWNAATLGANESFIVRVGFSDSGKALSSRFLTATSVDDPSTVLTFSGTGEITAAVPEPSQVALLLAGLGVMGVAARRRTPCRD